MPSKLDLVYTNDHAIKKDDIYHCSFVCNKHKKPKLRDLDESPILKKKRVVVGTNCKVCITIGDYDVSGKWIVCIVNLEHNHVLTPASSFLILTYRYIPFRYQKILQYNEEQDMLPKDNIDIVIRSAGDMVSVLLHVEMLVIIWISTRDKS
jgi:FAR1 DNA-binding domain